ncbi:MAG: nitroreductase family protein [Candidatus Aminicenantaceae bacterium]
MSLYELILSRRSIRQFRQEPIAREILQKLVDAARMAPSGANRQPLEYVIVDEDHVKKDLYPSLKWAGYITPRGNPKSGFEPAAYIIALANTTIRAKGYEWDAGAAIEHIILTALEEGIGSCWIASVDREHVRKTFQIPENYKIDSIVALGYPAEQPMTEILVDSVEYWKDDKGQLHVPKRTLESITHFNKF